MRGSCWAASLLVVLAGCSTTPTPVADAKPVDAAYLYKLQAPASDSDARLVVVRDQGFVGGGRRMGFYVDGQLVADLSPKEKAEFYVPAGVRILGAGTAASAKGLCAAAGDSYLRQREATLSPGQERKFRMTSDGEGNLDVLPLSP